MKVILRPVFISHFVLSPNVEQAINKRSHKQNGPEKTDRFPTLCQSSNPIVQFDNTNYISNQLQYNYAPAWP